MKAKLFNMCMAFSLTLSFYCCGDKGNNVEINLSNARTSFSAPITSIYKSPLGDGLLYIGLDNGNIIVKKGDKQDIIHVGNNRVYDIYAHSRDSIFAGVRDEGLKLVLHDTIINYKIKHKEYFYAVYSITANKKDGILYLGTSNGCFSLDLKGADKNNYLLPVYLESEYYSGINKVIYKDSTLYIAADSGLFCKKQDESSIYSLRKGIQVNNINIKGNLLYVLYNDSVSGINTETHKPEGLLETGGRFYSLEADGMNGGGEWLLSKNQLIYKKDNIKYTHTLPDISVKGRNISLLDSAYYYAACNEELIQFPVHQDLTGNKNGVIAVSEKCTDDNVYFITNELDLYRYTFTVNENSLHAKFIGEISGIDKIEDDIIKFIWKNNKGFLFTDKYMYKIEDEKAKCILKFDDDGKDDFRSAYLSGIDPEKLYIGTRKNLIYTMFNSKGDSIIPIPVTIDGKRNDKDLYIVDILEDNNKEVNFLCLNRGTHRLDITNSGSSEICHTEKYGSARNMAQNGDKLYVSLSEGIFEYDISKDTLRHLSNFDPKYIRSIHCDKNSNGIFILYYHGLSYCLLSNMDDPQKLQNMPVTGLDIPFNKTGIAVNQNKVLLGSRSGLFEYQDGRLDPVVISKPADYKLVYIIIAIILFISGMIALYSFWQKKQKKKTRQQYRRELLEEIEEEIGQSRNRIETQVRKEKRGELIRKTNEISEDLRKYKNAFIKSKDISSFRERKRHLDKTIDDEALNVKSLIEKYLGDASNRLENLNKYPKIKSDDIENRRNEIELLKKQIEEKGEYYTVFNAELLVAKIAGIEKIHIDNIHFYRHIIDDISTPEVEEKIKEIEDLVINYRTNKKADIRHACEDFVNAHPQLRMLPFMQRKGQDANRFYIAVLYLVKDVKAKDVSNALGIDDPQYVARAKFSMRGKIEELYDKNPDMKKIQIIDLLYTRLKNSKEN